MFRENRARWRATYLVLDALCIAAAFALAFIARDLHPRIPVLGQLLRTPYEPQHIIRADYAVLLLVSSAAWIFGLSRPAGSTLPGQVRHHAYRHVRGLLYAITATSVCVFLIKLPTVSRLYFGYFFALGALLLAIKATILLWIRNRKGSGARSRILVVGTGPALNNFLAVLRQWRVNQTAMVFATAEDVPEGFQPFPRGGTEAFTVALKLNGIRDAIFVGTASELADSTRQIDELLGSGISVSLATASSTTSRGISGRITEICGVPVLYFGSAPADDLHTIAKRVIDVSLSACILACSVPVFAAVAAVMRIVDPGPVLFRQRRLGLDGRPFDLLKFRSMRVDAEAVLRQDAELYAAYVANDFKLPEDIDPRISPLGRVLRHTSIDELPQLINVLRGDMSLVGPRPIVPAELEKYEPFTSFFLSVKPGLTGLWQVNGRSDIHYPDRAYLELDYVSKHSLAADLRILLRTIPAVLFRRGAR